MKLYTDMFLGKKGFCKFTMSVISNDATKKHDKLMAWKLNKLIPRKREL